MLQVTGTHPSLQKSTDEDLMDFVKAGNTEGLAILFDRYYRLVFNIACKILRDRAEAEDLMQEVFLEIYRDAAKFNAARGSFKTWLLQYAYHRSLNRRKYLATRGLYEIGAVRTPNAEVAEPVFHREGLSAQDWARTLQNGLQQLNSKERQAIELACFQGLLLREIADHLKESLPNVRNHYYRGLKKLRKFMGTNDSEVAAELPILAEASNAK